MDSMDILQPMIDSKNKGQSASLIGSTRDVSLSFQIHDDSVFQGTVGNPN